MSSPLFLVTYHPRKIYPNHRTNLHVHFPQTAAHNQKPNMRNLRGPHQQRSSPWCLLHFSYLHNQIQADRTLKSKFKCKQFLIQFYLWKNLHFSNPSLNINQEFIFYKPFFIKCDFKHLKLFYKIGKMVPPPFGVNGPLIQIWKKI